jgi:hypothetical protein
LDILNYSGKFEICLTKGGVVQFFGMIAPALPQKSVEKYPLPRPAYATRKSGEGSLIFRGFWRRGNPFEKLNHNPIKGKPFSGWDCLS